VKKKILTAPNFFMTAILICYHHFHVFKLCHISEDFMTLCRHKTKNKKGYDSSNSKEKINNEAYHTCPNSSFRSEVLHIAGWSVFSQYSSLSHLKNKEPINFCVSEICNRQHINHTA
jgi:hypothetical protein